MEVASAAGANPEHCALFFRTIDEYAAAVAEFLLAGDALVQPAFIAVPHDRHAKLWQALKPRLRAATAVASPPARTTFADMSELGRNPGRIIPIIQAFLDTAAGPARFVGEPIWPGRTAPEMREGTRHEALINLAFAGSRAAILCPYDVTRLPDRVIADARRTHPVVETGGTKQRSLAFAGGGQVPEDCDAPLADPPSGARVARYRSNLREVRDLIAEHARMAGLAETRTTDLVLAVSEVAANTLRHTDSGGTIRIWRADGELICQLCDTGYIADPLAGRRAPAGDHPGGQGLWLVHQVCDLVELRTAPGSTTMRMHMRLDLPRTLIN